MATGRVDRLRTPDHFKRVLREGKRVNTAHLFVHSAERQDDEPGRYGLAVSRKLGGAVERNRIRRQLRAAVREVGGAPAGIDWVIMPKSGGKVSVGQLANELSQIMAEVRRSTPKGMI
ncbi:MAG TPA: ribonuclease P protein component [Actinomycetota bacterium]|nr:ribonuclease P protein component [Actinomycetota bacterium]